MKSHFLFSKKQRNGIFFLCLIIVVLQCIYFFVDFTSEAEINNLEIAKFEKELDSLQKVALEKQKPKIYPFNPNYITDYKGYTLGMSNEEINRLLQFRKQDRWINSKKDFQRVTKVSDALLAEISPYFKFPDWVTNPKPSKKNYNSYSKEKTYNQKVDLNKATAQQLQSVNGVGEKLASRIIKFRDKFSGGFIHEIQLIDVYGLSPEVIERINNDFAVKTPRKITKIDLNKATVGELVTIQHIDYELAYEIVNQRTLREGFKTLEELEKVKGFPDNKIEIIKLYLKLH